MGGNLNNGRNCSPVNFNCNNAPSNSNWNRASRNFYKNQKIKTSAYLIPCRLAKIVDTAGISKRIYILPRIPETIKKNGEQMRSFNIDSKVKDREIIQRAITKICKKKKKKKNASNRKYKLAQHILKNIEAYTDSIREMIIAFEKVSKSIEQGQTPDPQMMKKAYQPRRCETFQATCGPAKKDRSITGVPLYPDQIIQQVLIEAAEPVFMRGAYEYSCGSIPKKGTHKGVRYIKKIVRKHKNIDRSAIKYAAQLDITKCYPSISHTDIKEKLKKKFRGKLFTWLAFAVIDSYHDEEADGEFYGLAIGYPTSQWFCNFTLAAIDHMIKCKEKIRYYVRYMDDMIMYSRNKKALHNTVKNIMAKLKSMQLKIKKNWQVFRFDFKDKLGKRKGKALDTLGYRFFRDKIILRKRNALIISRQARRIKKAKKITPATASSFMSRIGALKHCNSRNFYKKNIKPFADIKQLKEVISNESRKHSKAQFAI